MRVVLPMVTLVRNEMGGSETYGKHLIEGLASRSDITIDTIVALTAAGFSAPGTKEHVLPHVNGGPSSAQRLFTVAQGMTRPGLARSVLASADVVHYPFSVPVPRPPARRPFVQSLLDTQHLDLPHLFSAAERRYRSLTYHRTARRASVVITISEFSRAQAIRHLRLDPGRVHVVHLGVSASLQPSRQPRHQFVLYPARAWPHKNHERLVQAMQQVREQHPNFRLVLTGGAQDRLGVLPEWVDLRGHVSEPELLDLYRTAACLAFPSLYEGFGLPVLEAMALGCPVAASNAGALPEICGNAAILFDPTDVRDIARGITQALHSDERFVDAGLARVRHFTWSQCADKHVAAYRQAIKAATGGMG